MSYYNLISLMPKTAAFDPDAQAFITAAAITDPTQQSAINTLVVNLKGYSIWSKMKAVYPFVGGTAATHKFNLKNPLDTNAAFRLVFNGGWTHSVNGATPNGTNGYADTKLIPSTILTTSSAHFSKYNRTNDLIGNKLDGVSSGGADFFQHNYTGANGLIGQIGALITYIQTDSRGLFTVTRTATNLSKVFKNATQQGTTNTTTITALPSLSNVYIGARNNSGVGEFYNSYQCAFASIGDGLTDAEAANFYTAVQAFQTTIGRSIGTQTVSDADAQAFVTAANIVDQVEANAVNNLVIGMKADGIWTKMSALYPFVGSTASQQKFNLKNPLDTDAAFRLTFSGGWTHSSTGAKPNGTNAYADTYLIPSANFNTSTFNHLSYYSRSNTAVTGEYAMGAYNGVGNHGLIIRRDTNLGFFVSDYATSTSFRSAGGTGVTDGRGLFLGSQTGTNAKLYKNGSVIYNNNGATLNNAIPNNKIYIGVLNETALGSYTDKECAFASIGDGLTDAEAGNLNSRVQTFQTALNRQVP